MRILCINSGNKWVGEEGNYKGPDERPIPVEGEYYNVVNTMELEDGVYYQLAEIPPSPTEMYVYVNTMFAHISDIDETELIRQRYGVTV